MSATSPCPPSELKRVLVVDDEPVVLVALRETLRLQGYEVFAVEDPLVALELLRETLFSVIVCDQRLSTLTGVEFLAQAKEIQPNSMRILISAVHSVSLVIDAINTCEVFRFIVKPWLRDELLGAVQNAAQRYERLCRIPIRSVVPDLQRMAVCS